MYYLSELEQNFFCSFHRAKAFSCLTASQAVHVDAPVIDDVWLPAVQVRHSPVSACGA